MNDLTEQLRSSNAKKYLLFMLLFLLTIDLSVILDIPIFKQFLGFIFLTFVPGLLILYLLKLNMLGLTEKVVLSVGLSISFLMFSGLLINWVYPAFGYDTPLSRNSLLISFSVIVLILVIIAYLRNQDIFKLSDSQLKTLRLSTKEKAFLFLPAFFPPLSILGMHIMNTTDNNAMLMVLLFLIPAYAIFISVKHKQVPDRIYPPIIFLTSISLVLLLGLRSNHIIGVDIHTEYYLFQQTVQNGQWQILLNCTYDSCLSISILPTTYQCFLSIDSEYLMKILYPLLFSVSPLVVYIISQKYIGNFYASLASLFFMSQYYFLWAAFSPRTVLAILFFALSVMVLFHRVLTDFNKKLLFIIFAASCIVSHYSTTYIFFLALLLSWLGMQIIPRTISSQRKPTLITFGSVVLFFVMLFFWYSQITGVTFDSGVSFIISTLKSLQKFFILESRGEEVAVAFGTGLGEKGIPPKINFVFSWLTVAFIAIGVLGTLARYRHTVAFATETEGKTSGFLSQKLDAEFFILSLVCSSFLVTSVALPYVSVGYGMDRAYCQMMAVLSPFFVIGGIMIASLFRAKWAYLVILVVLIPYFICQTGTTYQIFGFPGAMTLNSEGQQYDVFFVHNQETSAAKWLRDYTQEGTKIYVDYGGGIRLLSQGGIRSSVYPGAFIEEHKPLEGGYIYLRYCGTVDDKLVDKYYQWHDIAEYQEEFIMRDLIYNNGGSEIWG
jgi:uncharacterized membrane protein